MHTLFALGIGFALGGFFYMYMYSKHIKTSKIRKLEQEVEKLKINLEFEEYCYSEEHEYANDLLELLVRTRLFVEKEDMELYKEIEQVIKSASV